MNVPEREIPFLLDQHVARKMVISDIDKDVSKMWARAAARDEAMEVAVEIEKSQAEFRQEQVHLDFSNDSADDDGNNNKSKLDKDYIQTTISDDSFKRNVTKRPNLASVCNRYGMSNYAIAARASATMVDYVIITKVNRSQIIGSQKLVDEKRRCREERREAELGDLKKLTFLYFDGKKSMTRALAKNNKTGR